LPAVLMSSCRSSRTASSAGMMPSAAPASSVRTTTAR
jgi:hypothetical protein